MLYQVMAESYFSSDLNLGSTWLPIILVVCHLVYTDGNYGYFCCAWMVQTENPVSLCLLWRKHKEIILVSKDSAPNNTVHGKISSFLLTLLRLCRGKKRPNPCQHQSKHVVSATRFSSKNHVKYFYHQVKIKTNK